MAHPPRHPDHVIATIPAEAERMGVNKTNSRVYNTTAIVFTVAMVPAVFGLAQRWVIEPHAVRIPNSGLVALWLAAWCLGCAAITTVMSLVFSKGRGRVPAICCAIALVAIVTITIVAVQVAAAQR